MKHYSELITINPDFPFGETMRAGQEITFKQNVLTKPSVRIVFLKSKWQAKHT